MLTEKFFSQVDHATLHKAGLIGLRVVDYFAIFAASLITLRFASGCTCTAIPFWTAASFILAELLIWAYLIELSYLPKIPRTTRYRSIFLEFLVFNVISFTILAFLKLLFRVDDISFVHLGIFFVINLLLLFLVRMASYSLFRHYRAKGYNLHNVLVIADQYSDQIIKSLIDHKEWGYRIMGIITESRLIRAKYWDHARIISPRGNYKKFIESDVIDEVIYCASTVNQEMIEELINYCREVGIIFTMKSNFTPLDPSILQMEVLYPRTSLTFSYTPTSLTSLLLKSLTDLIFSSFVLICSLPFFILIGILIKLDSPGPVFFKQQRIGLHGRKFNLYKFRTMIQEAEGQINALTHLNEADVPAFKIRKDPRITFIGYFLRKTGLDEMPQFYNVLKGEMSIIGPRPPLEKEVEQYKPWQLRRLSVKPGITCIWQVAHNRNAIKFDQWINMDLKYIDSWSPKLDTILFFKTFKAMLNGEGD